MIFNIFEDALDISGEKVLVHTPVVFIGHGRNNQWMNLKNHLSDLHHYKVVTFETGVRAGCTIKEVLEELLNQSHIALLVHTAEDEDAAGEFRARQNVIHETGLFQGRLGFKKAIVLLEEGCREYSNLAGIQQLRFRKGSIQEIYGEIVATINREFNPN